MAIIKLELTLAEAVEMKATAEEAKRLLDNMAMLESASEEEKRIYWQRSGNLATIIRKLA